MKIFALSLATTLSAFSVSCSRSEFLFDFADTFAVSKADDYFDLNSEQKSALKKDIQQDLKTAKKEVFPKLAQKLRALEPAIDKGAPTIEYLSEEMTGLQAEVKKATSFFKDTAVKTALTLTPAQINHFAEEVRDDMEDREDIEEAREKIEKRYRRSLEFWMGGISKQQREKIAGFLTLNPYPTALEIKNKEYVLNQFLTASKNPEELKKFVVRFAEDYESVRLMEYTTALNSHKKAFQKFLAQEFWPTIDNTQRGHLKKNLLGRAEELERLARKP